MDKNSLYQPTGQKVPGVNATYVPDLYRQVAEEMRAEEGGAQLTEDENRTLTLQKRPIIGVLYSISACVEGELFPIYVGRNTIGSDLSCDICLRETSVSPQHGLLLARKQMDVNGEEYVNVYLSDSNSNYGTMVNSERLGFEKIECKDGDVITVGQNYVLIVSLFNAINKLSISYGFDRIQDNEKPDANEDEVDVDTEESLVQPDMEPSDLSLMEEPSDPVDHSNATTKDPQENDPTVDFYKPTKKTGGDHYNNKTIIL